MQRRGWRNWSRRRESGRERTTRIGEGIGALTKRLDGGLGLRLAALWRHWGEVLGQFAEMARPLGRKRRTLILGCEDAMAMQELTFVEEEILERVHEFLGEECFDKVRFDLIEGRASLDMIKPPKVIRGERRLPRPANLGGVRELLDNETAIGRSYRAYVALMHGRGAPGGEGGGR